jgi:hypothetical protein
MEENNQSKVSQEMPEVPPVPEVQPVVEEEEAAEKPRRSAKWFIIAGVLIVFLGAAAFLGARLLKPQQTDANGVNGNMMVLSQGGGPGGVASKSVRLNVTPAPELPVQQADTAGLFVRREDQSIFLGTGNVTMMVKQGADNAPPEQSANYDGPVVEVVINHDTKIYQDISDFTPNMNSDSGEQSIQQVVKPGSLDDLTTNSMISVWGEKRGDRYIAKVISFR